MASFTLKTFCPQMAVRPVRLFRPLGDRRTDELVCPSEVFIDGVTYHFDLTFPQCLVTVNRRGDELLLPKNVIAVDDFDAEAANGTMMVPRSRVTIHGDGRVTVVPDRIVEAVTAFGSILAGYRVSITYDAEAVIDLHNGLMLALPCDGVGSAGVPGYGVMRADSQLPSAISRPGGPFKLGWLKHTVDAVELSTTFTGA